MPDICSDKELVKAYWNNEPCGTGSIGYPEGSLEYFESIAKNRDRLDYFIPEYAQFEKWKNKKVLEVGCGAGSDLVRFARAGALVTGIDLSSRSAVLTKHRLNIYGCRGNIFIGDAEKLPFDDGEFDFLWCWGVLHHTPDTEKAISEIYRVMKPSGRICIMLYHKWSLVGLQMWILFGLLKGRPFRGLDEILAEHHESVGTKAYSVGEVREMFSAFDNVRVDVRITAYDIRYGRDKYLPKWMWRIVPSRFGWNLVVQGNKRHTEITDR